ncbi:MAG TPA: galactose oxidase early set domain-containing protein [Vicinamibacterales bacterium]|nr:galactose oxidase early set domain-containing protein [Vicinamibacterales bacterium]
MSASWDQPLEDALKIVGVHAVVLRTGKVLYWCFDARCVNHKENLVFFNNPMLGSYQIWDPVSGAAGPVKSVGRNVFCAGQCTNADGTIFLAGGQDGAGAVDLTGQTDKWFAAQFGSDNGAQLDVNTYDPVADTWTRWPDMQDGRYYPTVQILDNGCLFIAGGLSNLQQFVFSGSNWCQNDQWEMYTEGLLGLGPTPQKHFMTCDQYPILRLLPGSRKLFVHWHRTTYIWDLDASSFVPGAEFLPPSPVGRQTYPMQSGYCVLPQMEGEDPRILIVGGSTATGYDYNTHSDAPAVRGAFIFEFNRASPVDSFWRTTVNPPNHARLLSDTVLLPDGTVFVVNGIATGAASGHSANNVFEPELFDPAGETFTVMPMQSTKHPRAYHSTAVLLPDGRVAIAGNTALYNNPDPGAPPPVDDTSIEIFNPPYLSRGPRPAAKNLPPSADYGQVVPFEASAGPAITKAIMMRPCAVTHTQDMDQRAVWLKMTTDAKGKTAFAVPTDRSLAPPGPYMIFFLTADGIPSVAQWMFVGFRPPERGGGGPGGGGGGPWPPVYLGTYENNVIVDEVFDGDITIEKIDQHCNVTIESRHGSITINDKCDQHCYVNLKAATTVTIGQKIDQHCNVTIQCNGNVEIGQKIDGNSEANIKSANGSIHIGQKIDGPSQATLFAPNGTVKIDQKVDGGSVVTWQGTSFTCPDTNNATITRVP